MDDKELKILKMLEEGKINAGEAADLLRAMRDDGRGRRPRRPRHPRRPWGRRGGEGPQHHLQRAFSRIPEMVDSVLESVESIDLDIDIPVITGTQRFEEVVEGRFDDGVEQVELDLSTLNGRIEVETWSRPDYQLTVLRRVRARDEDEARDIAAGLGRLEQRGDALRFAVPDADRRHGGVNLSLSLPQNLTYGASLKTSNGRIDVANLICRRLDARTDNGSIRLDGLRAEEVESRTVNGRVKAAGDVRRWNLGSVNGSIACRTGTETESMRLETTNGSVYLSLPGGDAIGHDVTARTAFGSISLDLPDLEYLERQRLGHRAEVRARTRDCDQRDRQMKVEASTSSGRIDIGMPAEND